VSKIKNMSRAGWIITGVVAALVLVPTVAVAASTVVNIKGSPSGNKADVSPDNQLYTVEAEPTKYQDYFAQFDTANGTNGSLDCTYGLVPTVPTGEAFIIRELDINAHAIDGSTTYSFDGNTGYQSSASAALFVDPSSASGNTGCITAQIAVVAYPYFSANTGEDDWSLPINPGYVIPAGDQVALGTSGVGGDASVFGYFVPAADAPGSPQ